MSATNSTVASTSVLVASSSTTPSESSSAALSSSASSSLPSSASLTVSSSSGIPSSSAPASSSPVDLSSSTPPASSSSLPPSSSAAASSSEAATSVVTVSSQPASTQIVTSLVTVSPSVSGQSASVVVVTSVITPSQVSQATSAAHSASSSSTTTAPASLQNPEKSKDGGGLGTGGKTAIAVVVPVVVVALLVLAGILLWRRRKQKKTAEEARRKEVEEYGFNPNNDPTLPAVGMQSEMAEDESGYRGWGNTTSSSNRKASTTLTSGMAYSDSTSNPGGYQSPGSPTQGAHSDAQSNDPLMNGRRETLDSEGISALGAAPAAGQNQAGVHRGPSNASSSYSAANRSDNSGEYPMPSNNPQDYYDNHAYYQPGPYGGDPYAGSQQPVIRDVSARRNTRIENPSVFPQQGNSGISQNF